MCICTSELYVRFREKKKSFLTEADFIEVLLSHFLQFLPPVSLGESYRCTSTTRAICI